MGGSRSSSSSENKTLNEDNRIVADGESVALGKEASLIISNEFNENVGDAFSSLVDLVKTTVEGAGQITHDSMQNVVNQSNESMESVNEISARSIQGEKSIYTDIFPMLAVVAVAVMAVAILKKK